MSGPAGKGSGPANFSNIVQSALKRKDQVSKQESSDSANVGPSKGLPATGLKRNTQEWKDEHSSSDVRTPSGSGGRRSRRSSQSSSSSIPSDATGGTETPSTTPQSELGPPKIRSESPQGLNSDERREDGKDEDGQQTRMSSGRVTPIPPNAHDDTKLSSKTEHAIGMSDGKQRSSRDKSNSQEEKGSPDIDDEERIQPRDHDDNKVADEIGRMPGSMSAVKWEEAPGSRNTITLGARIPHQHYHRGKEQSPDGSIIRPILKVTPDGEGEYPPGETPQPSRGSSVADLHHSGRGRNMLESNQLDADGWSEGKWTSALDSKSKEESDAARKARKHLYRRRPEKQRFSSFRDDDRGSRSDRKQSHERSDQRPAQSSSESETPTPAPNTDSDDQPNPREMAQRRWSLLRSRVLPSKHGEGGPSPNKVSGLSHTTITSIPVTTELFAGQLPVMMLKTWIDRDEDGRRAVPVLLGNLRFRVGDSVGLKAGKETGKEMFKVECEYGDGIVKWVIYRELRDFLSLHANYKAANFGTSVGGLRSSRRVEIPEFPKMGLGAYLNNKRPGNQAQANREALQKYLVGLIRAVIFRPESNRLCKFFELSALTLSLAPYGGFQGKAGYLSLPGSNASRRANQPGLTPQSWIHNRSPKWFMVRDTYFVVTEGPEHSEFYDVFMLDQDFSIERPKRVYRHGLQIVSGRSTVQAIKHSHHKNGSPMDDPNVDLDNPMTQEIAIVSGEGRGMKGEKMDDDGEEAKASQHTFFIVNSQRRLKLVAKNARHMHQFIVSMERVAAQCIWTQRNRFDSFAPLRVNVAAQWLVDGRDYFWNLSRAINMAKNRIYIHDWWISPEIYLRRPGDERYRLDNLLKRKAEEGVQIHIIIYNEVSDKTTPVDSLYTKKTLMGLHSNIFLQRSPSHFQTGTFYWSHHEKLCVIDETIAFMGGLDLCYGRWDTSQHVLTDEDHTAPDGPDGPVWRGKDYSNERVMEYSNLDKPFDDMFDRGKVPRMPWHDVGLQIVGQPARDLCRHFVQRWNLLLRMKNHTRKMPFLLPPPDFTDRELAESKLRGTCEVQICRSVGPWSMGTLQTIEHSVQNAYCKSIQLSEHFVYIENQFFITSTIVDGIQIHNGIGDALVDRIIKAHKEKQAWRACIVIPLLPGYTYPLDSAEASSVRLILECQNRTIARGANSIFSRLRKEGIDPDEYITFFSLRAWAKFKSGVLTTEQVYIHGKTMIVDDRLVLCGSANINERSQRGDRDSELVAVIRDTDMIDGKMAGKPYKVGRFAHTLRMRLMREHVGIDVDSIEEDQLMSRKPIADADEIEIWDPDHEQEDEDDVRDGITKVKKRGARDRLRRTFQTGISGVTKGFSENALDNIHRAADTVIHPVAVIKEGQAAITPGRSTGGDESERKDYDRSGKQVKGFASSVIPTLEEKTIYERRPSATHANGKPLLDLIDENDTTSNEGHADSSEQPHEAQVPPEAKEPQSVIEDDKNASRTDKAKAAQIKGDPEEKELYGIPANGFQDDDKPPTKQTERADIDEEDEKAVKARSTLRKHLSVKTGMSPWAMPTPTPKINPNRFVDPLDTRFWKDMWVAVAVHNTEIYRKVFRCIPDDLVTTWAAYKAFANHAEKHNKKPEDVAAPAHDEPVKVVHDGPGTHGAGGGGSGGGAVGQGTDDDKKASKTKSPDVPSKLEETLSKIKSNGSTNKKETKEEPPEKHNKVKPIPSSSGEDGNAGVGGDRKPSGPNDPWASWEREEMETLLGEIRGHLVVYPQRFLEIEDQVGNLLFQSDKILPLPIYD